MGLNRWPNAHTGGGGFSPNTLSRDTEKDGQRDTSGHQTWRTIKIYNIFTWLQYTKYKLYIIIFDWQRQL
jgi:hypothetical protein